MKSIFLLSMLVLLSMTGCVTRIYTIQQSTIDYSEYTKSGFYISESSNINFDFEPISSVNTTVFSGSKKGWSEEKKQLGIKDGYWGDWKKASYVDALDNLYKEAKKLGANGIINLTYEATYTKEGTIDFVYVKGMAIKRK